MLPQSQQEPGQGWHGQNSCSDRVEPQILTFLKKVTYRSENDSNGSWVWELEGQGEAPISDR